MSKKCMINIFESTKIVLQIGVNDKGKAVVCSNPVDNIEELNSDYINEHFSDLQDTAYQRGFEDGKAVHEKGCEGCKYTVMGSDTTICSDCCNAYHNQWTAKKSDNRIEIGDEVKWDGNKCIVTYRHIDINTGVIRDYDLMACDGSLVVHVKKCSFAKTGRHFDIDKILEEMRHD